MKAPSDRLFTAWILVGLIGLLLSLEACGGGDDKKGTARPTAPGQEASISGTIDLDRSLKERVAKEPLLMVLVSRPRVSLDTLLGSMMLHQGGGHAQTQERQKSRGRRPGAGRR